MAAGILIYFVYSNFISGAQVWLARGSMPAWLGLWWVHIVVVLLAVVVISGPRWLARARYRPYQPAAAT